MGKAATDTTLGWQVISMLKAAKNAAVWLVPRLEASCRFAFRYADMAGMGRSLFEKRHQKNDEKIGEKHTFRWRAKSAKGFT